jgi:hypothetical protein
MPSTSEFFFHFDREGPWTLARLAAASPAASGSRRRVHVACMSSGDRLFSDRPVAPPFRPGLKGTMGICPSLANWLSC